MSQGSQGPFAAGRTILPLAKFSYATVHGESKIPIPWFHISRSDNLFAIFESQRVEDTRGQTRDAKKFKVINDPEVLEDIDLDVLASEANRARAEAQDPRRNDKLVTVIIKIPCIAIRYPLHGGKIRRIQIRLTSNEDYYETLKLLSRADVPVGEAGSFPTVAHPARPFSSSSSLLRPSDSASQLGLRPVSVSSRIGELANVHGDTRGGWISANSVRPTTSSGLAHGMVSGETSVYFGQSNRSPGLLDRSSMQFNSAPPITSPVGGVVSGYFGGPIESQSFRPRQAVGLDYTGSHSRIDLYQPRPSTAPMLESQNPSYMLPPKRELPFSNPTAPKKTKTGPARLVQEDTELAASLHPSSSLPDSSKLKTSVSDAVSAIQATSELSLKSAVTVPATKGKRAIVSKGPSKVPKPRAPKKQPSKVPMKRAAKVMTEKDVVPGVNQLFQEIKDTMDTVPTIDTQALLARVDATRLYQSIELPEAPKETVPALTDMSPPSSQTQKCSGCRTRKGKCNGQGPCDWCIDQDLTCIYDAPANPASQVLVPSAQPEAVAEAQRKPSLIVNNNAPKLSPEVALENEAIATAPEAAAQKASTAAEDHIAQQSPPHKAISVRQPEPQPVDPDATLVNITPSAAKPATTPALHLAPPADPFTLLLRETAFSQSNSLTSWVNLPESQQRSSLDTWMCQQISDPGFAALLNRLNESWQAALFGRSVGMNT